MGTTNLIIQSLLELQTIIVSQLDYIKILKSTNKLLTAELLEKSSARSSNTSLILSADLPSILALLPDTVLYSDLFTYGNSETCVCQTTR